MRNTLTSGRARRIAACTAIAVAAGTLLSTPALADTKGPGAPKAAATTKAKPRFDWDRDGLGEIVRNGSVGYPSSYLLSDSAKESGRLGPFLVDADLVGARDLVTPGDLDGNGMSELITVSSDGTLKLFANVNQDPYAATWTSTGWNVYNKIAAAGDLTGDGKNDLLARTYDGDLYLFPGTGDLKAPFGARIKVPGNWSDFDQIVGVSDADGDGIGDVYARNRTDDLLFFAGTGKAEQPFKPGVELGAGWHAYNQLLSADDRDGDGLSDLLARNLDGDLYLYRSIGGGRFADPVKYRSGWNDAQVIAGVGGRAAFGKSGLSGRDANGRVSSRRALNNGQFSAPSAGAPDKDYIGSAFSLDGTGFDTSLRLTGGHLVTSGYQSGGDLGAGWDTYTSITGPGDLNGDGHADLLARDRTGDLWLYPGDGSARKFGDRIRVGDDWKAYNKILGSGDVNGDGRADVLARADDGHLYLFPGTGNGSAPFGPRQDLGGGWNGYTMLATVADASGDGTTDLIAVDASGQGYRYDGQGAYGGKFKPRASLGGGWNTYNELF
ncbi:FG-GAP repeat domain-containing protein [Streptomyces sp. HUAS TT7]|uniref:FG-GAP repeat domain-containing protein n=1 Tax=Streptomyces sp. HUAS TT7 TaxID=3447507 RepID=UPI003F656A76